MCFSKAELRIESSLKTTRMSLLEASTASDVITGSDSQKSCLTGTSGHSGEKQPDAVLYSAMHKAENRVGGGEGLEGVYGSITRAGTAEVLDIFRLHASFDRDSILLDIGSGLGRPLLHAIIHTGVAATYGIEVDAVKCQKAVPFVQHCVSEMQGHGIHMPTSSLPKFICAPIEQIPSLEPATHVYAAWEGFARGAMESVGKLFALSSTAQAITIVQRSFRQRDPAEEMEEMGFGQVKLVASLPVYMAGSRRRLMAYCFVRTAVPKRSSKAVSSPAGDLSTMPAFQPDQVIDVLSTQASTRATHAACKVAAAQGGDAKAQESSAADDTLLARDTKAPNTPRCSLKADDSDSPSKSAVTAARSEVQESAAAASGVVGSRKAVKKSAAAAAAASQAAPAGSTGSQASDKTEAPVQQHRHGLRRRA